MKKRYINLLLIIMLVASLTLSGCTSKDESKDVQVDTEQEGEMGQSKDEEIEDEEVEDQKDNDEIKAGQEEEQEENKEDVEKVEQTEDTEGAEDTKEKDPLEEMSEKLTEKVEQLEQRESEDESSENNQEKDETKVDDIEEETNTLKVEGKVENKLQLSLDNLKEMDDIIFQGDFYSLNNFGTTAHTNFKGINLWMLLEEKAKISTEATKVTVIATDGYKMEFTIEEVKRQDYIDETDEEVKLPIIISWERNGEEYDSLEGPPFKLIIGQREPGDINKPQWVSNIDKITVE